VLRHWVIVRRDRPELFYPLSCAFLKRRGYVVVVDRREGSRRAQERPMGPERRRLRAEMDPFAIVPAAQQD
jgi:hypothetical protein